MNSTALHYIMSGLNMLMFPPEVIAKIADYLAEDVDPRHYIRWRSCCRSTAEVCESYLHKMRNRLVVVATSTDEPVLGYTYSRLSSPSGVLRFSVTTAETMVAEIFDPRSPREGSYQLFDISFLQDCSVDVSRSKLLITISKDQLIKRSYRMTMSITKCAPVFPSWYGINVFYLAQLLYTNKFWLLSLDDKWRYMNDGNDAGREVYGQLKHSSPELAVYFAAFLPTRITQD